MWAAAATRNAAEMVKGPIAKGAAVNARARFNDWPSQITSEPRAQYHASGGLTPLLYAARGGCDACVDALIAGGADVNLPTPEGVSPIMSGARERLQRHRQVVDGSRRQSASLGCVRADGALHFRRQFGRRRWAASGRGGVGARRSWRWCPGRRRTWPGPRSRRRRCGAGSGWARCWRWGAGCWRSSGGTRSAARASCGRGPAGQGRGGAGQGGRGGRGVPAAPVGAARPAPRTADRRSPRWR